jgi:hypothetical protein
MKMGHISVVSYSQCCKNRPYIHKNFVFILGFLQYILYSVLRNDTVNCCHYTASVIHERVRRIGGMTPTRKEPKHSEENLSQCHLVIRIFHRNLGCAVAQLVEALRYKPESRGFTNVFLLAALWSWGRLSL